MVSSLWVVTTPTVSPAATRLASAVACGRLVTSGTSIGAGPEETTRSTAVPAATQAVHWVGF